MQSANNFSNQDVQTDALIQASLRSSVFSARTIITIAHRINTIVDSDRIVVLDHGRVAEFDTPANLVAKKGGLFYELVREAGLLDSVGPREGVSSGHDSSDGSSE